MELEMSKKKNLILKKSKGLKQSYFCLNPKDFNDRGLIQLVWSIIPPVNMSEFQPLENFISNLHTCKEHNIAFKHCTK